MLDNKALYQQILKFTEDEIKGLANNQEYPVFKSQKDYGDYVDPGDYPTPEPSAPSPSSTPDVTPTPTPQPTPCICGSDYVTEIPANIPTDQEIQNLQQQIVSHNQTVNTWFASYNQLINQSNSAKQSIDNDIADIEKQKAEILEMAAILPARKELECKVIQNSKRLQQLKTDIDTAFRQMTIIGNNNMADMKAVGITPSKPTMTSPAKNFENALRCYKNFVCEGGGYDKDFFERNRFNLALINAMRRLTQGFVEYKAQWTLWKNAKKEKQDLLLHNARLRREINKLDENGLVSLYTITQKAKAIQAAIDTIKVAIDRYNTQFGPILEQLSTEKDNINAVAVSLTESIPEIQTTYVETERVDTICPVNGQPLTCYKYETKLKATSFSQVERADIGLGNTTLDKIDVPVFNSPVVVVDRCA